MLTTLAFSRRSTGRIVAALGLVATVSLLTACGGGGSSSSTPCPPASSTRAAIDHKVTICAFDIRFDTQKITTTAGQLQVTLLQKGSLPHTFTVENTSMDLKVDDKKEATGTLAVAAGKTYVFFCSTPGHRAAMHGTIVVR